MLRFAFQNDVSFSMSNLPEDLFQHRSEEFDFPLPDEQIARFPVQPRDHSRLLLVKNGELSHHQFFELPQHLPKHSLLFFNNTKVLPARLLIKKKTGTWIEVLLIQHEPILHAEGFQIKAQALVGNKKKWKDGEMLTLTTEGTDPIRLELIWANREEDAVFLRWFPENLAFPEVLNAVGQMPIPPYLQRQAVESDKTNYQTWYARQEGAIAAPTAGLHFTPEVLEDLEKQGNNLIWLTLHVGLGTFRPLKTERIADHDMHAEEVVVSVEALQNWKSNGGFCIAVGTTSLRTLESLYWVAFLIRTTGQIPEVLQTEIPYLHPDAKLKSAEVAGILLKYLEERGESEIRFFTRLYILPGYKFRIVEGLITNFHQPKSTLLVLISAFLGQNWKEVYKEALEQKYRFLSYGDSSLLIP
jgi:S-adenosylmethionine:tRNA ribosyltransferase-isomerase